MTSSLVVNPNSVSITIADDGIGLHSSQSDRKGYGLNNMIRRVKENNGEIDIDSPQSGGTRITIRLPLC